MWHKPLDTLQLQCRVQDPDYGDEARDEAKASGDSAGDGNDSEGVGWDGGIAGVDEEVCEGGPLAAWELGSIGIFCSGKD